MRWEILGLAGLERTKVARPRPADRAEPVVGDVLEGRARRDAPVRVADRRVIDEAAALADPLRSFFGRRLHLLFLFLPVFGVEADRDRFALGFVFDFEVLARGEAALV